jgi:hypothetical protein
MHDRRVRDRAGKWSGIDVVAEGIARGVRGHRAQSRLQADQPAARGRAADRTCAVGAERHGAEPGRHGRRATAARAAWRAREVPGIARDAEGRPVGQALHAELRGRRLGDDDGARRTQALDQDVVGRRGGIVLEDRRAVPRRHALHVDKVFHADRYAMQRAQRLALAHRRFGCPGVAPCLLVHDGAEAIQPGSGRVGSLQDRVDIVDGRQLSGADEGGGLDGRHEQQIGIGHLGWQRMEKRCRR